MDVVNEKTSQKIMPYIKAIENGLLKSPISLHLLITDYCVNKCNMCGHWKTNNKKVLSFEILKTIWNEMNLNGGESICLTGGDPVIHPEFNEILELERKFDLGIITTGNFRSNFKWELLSGLKWIRFSIDSLNPDRYKIIRGMNNLYTTIIPNLEKALELNKEVGINFTIQKLNHDEIINIVNFCIEHKVYRLMLYPMHGNFDLAIGKDEIESIVKQLRDIIVDDNFEKIPENNIKFLYYNLRELLKEDKTNVRELIDLDTHPCMINKIHLAIGADGSVYPCEMILDDTDSQGLRNLNVKYQEYNGRQHLIDGINIHNIGNINNDLLIDIWKKYYYYSFESDKCKNCYSRYRPIIETYYNNKDKKVFI